MSEARTPPGERIERTHYGERQHGTASNDEAIRYGDPQHDPEQLRPEQVARLGYEDVHWEDGKQRDDDRRGDDNRPSDDGRRKDDAQEASDRRDVKDGRDEDYGDRYGDRPAFEVPSEALVLFG